MKSPEHAAVGGVVGTVAVATLFPTTPLATQAALWVAGLLFSVFVDLDHFLIARLMTGDWTNLRRAVSDLRVGFVDQEEVFADLSDERALQRYRLLSHHLIGGVLVGASALVDARVSVLVAVLLYAHLLGDLVRDAELA